ncbi:GtrA family protein [Candidatus Parcubacteria bacterium]|nr:GtrA family protein [Candidatus Parcubacteria bacterium]
MVKYIVKKIYQNKIFIKFGISGSTAATVDFSLLYLLHGIYGINLRVSASLAFVVAFFVSFYMQKLWTFKGDCDRKTHKQLLIFFGVGIFNTTINACVVPYLANHGIHYLIAQAISGLTLSVGSFIMYKYVIFKKSHKDLKKKNLFKPDKFNGLRVLIASAEYNNEVENIRFDFKNQGDRVKIVTFTEDESSVEGIYKISNKKNIVGRLFEYFYHSYKIMNWSDIVYVRGNFENVLLVFLACKIKRENYIWEFSDNCLLQDNETHNKQIKFLKNIKKRIMKNAKLIVVRNEKMRNVVLDFGVKNEKIISLSENENIKIAEYLL